MILSPYSKGSLGASISTFNEVKRKNLTNDTRTTHSRGQKGRGSQLSCSTDSDSPSLHWKTGRDACSQEDSLSK